MDTYKVGQVRPVTLNKYYLVEKRLKELVPDLDLGDMTRADVQRLINEYGKTHEYPTVLDFLHHIQAPLRDAVYEGWIAKDPTYKVHATSQVKHKETRFKYLESDQVSKLVKVLEKDDSPEALMFLFDLKTGLRFAEIFGLTPKDIDLKNLTLYVNKTWNYKEKSDRAIPFLIFNMAIRGMNGVAIQCDSLSRKAKQAYFIKNDSANFLAFSKISKIPHTKNFEKELNIKWE